MYTNRVSIFINILNSAIASYIYNFLMIYIVQRLGESCIDSRQCKEAIPYSMCSADTYCECQQGYLQLNSSCLPGKPIRLWKCNLNALNNASHRVTVICDICISIEELYILVLYRATNQRILHLPWTVFSCKSKHNMWQFNRSLQVLRWSPGDV